MEKIINNLKINYVSQGKNQDILILHGWGSNIEIFSPMIEFLATNNRVTVLDLPGFGKSDTPKSAWKLDDYVEFIYDFIKETNINNPIIIGHSFGGRIAIKIGSSRKVKINKIILIDSAGIKKEKKLSLKIKTLKLLKNILGKIMPNLITKMKNKMGSTDYKNASPIMKEILVNVINEDLTPLLNKIDYSTLLIWGENDQETPISDALIMENNIQDSGLVKVPNAGHYSFLDNPNLVYKVITSFINGGN